MKIILCFVSFISALSQAQTGKLIYGSRVQKEGQSKEELYLTAKMWFATEFKNSTVHENAEEGRLSAEASFEYMLLPNPMPGLRVAYNIQSPFLLRMGNMIMRLQISDMNLPAVLKV